MGKDQMCMKQCVECLNRQPGSEGQDGRSCELCGGYLKPIGWIRNGAFEWDDQFNKNKNIEIKFRIDPWAHTLIQSLPKAFEEAAKEGMPIDLAYEECRELIERIIPKAVTFL